MDAIKDALKNKIKSVTIHMHGGESHHMGEAHEAEGVDPKHLALDKDGDFDNNTGEDDKAPQVADDAKTPGHDEMGMLQKMSSGGAVGRSSMSLSERAKDKMKERMAAISKEKSKVC